MALLSVLTINIGSSSLKASFFDQAGNREDFTFTYANTAHKNPLTSALEELLSTVKHFKPDIIGHRFVHGGDVADAARLIDETECKRLESISHLAPLHMPKSLQGVAFCASHFDAPQVACFDTAFHTTLPELAYRLPIPKQFSIRRYGFHGLSYAYIAKQLPSLLGHLATGRVIVAHLGSGASLCMLTNLVSVDTTMGYTPAGGIPMATRSGDIDPGVMLALAKQLPYESLCKLTYEQMGLYALSDQTSADVASLIKDNSAQAKFAINYFARQIRAAIGAMAAKFGGFEALVFTGGVGEHADTIRADICKELAFLGVELNEAANKAHATALHCPDTKPVLIIPCDEEREIAALCRAACACK